MKIFINDMKKLFAGQTEITTQFKLSIILYSVSALHLLLLILYIYLNILPLIIYNIYSLLFYQVMLYIKEQKKIILATILSIIEVTFHSVFTTLTLGNQFGFLLYIIILVPTTFYVTHTTQEIRHKKAFEIITSISLAITYVVTYLISEHFRPWFTIEQTWVRPAVYVFIVLSLFLFITFFSFLFTIEIQDKESILLAENEQLDSISKIDPLTHLLNRRSMEDYLKAAMIKAHNSDYHFSLVLCDIDDFKKVNDTYGHDCGDKVLLHVASILTGNCRRNDCICRWGGEEFLLLINGNRETAISVAERIRDEIATQSIPYEGQKVLISMTLGVSEYIPGYRLERLIQLADQYLYYGKSHGKNIVISKTSIL